MLFNSPIYIFLFLPIVFYIYFGLNKRRMVLAAKVWLVFSSLFFYSYWNPSYLILIVSSMFVNYFAGTLLHKNKTDITEIKSVAKSKGINRRIVLIVGVCFNLGLLGYFKYADFFLSNLAWITDNSFQALNLLLPLAISFFTFQQIAYLVDCYSEKASEYDLLNYCLFVTFFPQLIAGPIVHHKEMMPQFASLRNHVRNSNNISMGIFIFSLGLFKKVVIADTLSKWVSAGYDSQGALTFLEGWLASLSYTFQLYFDFSAYSDMAVGAALLFNIRLPVNFNSPYKAVNIQDFWQRWHMTLSRWLRDYIYIPLGGNRRGSFRIYHNLFMTFLLGGLWHGAEWTFIIWGSMHGVATIVHRFWQKSGCCMSDFWGWVCTFLFVHITWVFFRANSIDHAISVLKGMMGLNGFYSDNPVYTMRVEYWILIALLIMVVVCTPNSMQMGRLIPYQGKWSFRANKISGFAVGIMAAIGCIGILISDGSEFLYFNF